MRYLTLAAAALLLAVGIACTSGAYDRDNQALMDAIPHYPGATLVARTKFTERFPTTSRSLVYVHATTGTPEQVLAFFTERLAAAGWQRQTGGKDQISGSYYRGDEQLEINAPSTILEPNYVDAKYVTRLTPVPEDTAMIFSVVVNARAGAGPVPGR